MTTTNAKRLRLLITLGIIFLLAGGTAIAIRFAKGYRPDLGGRVIEGTGLLSATSYPKSAQVFINDRLTTATDGTLYLSPDTYQVKIVKEGFSAWTKSMPISKELVSSTDARLFPSIPSISPLTFSGAINPSISPDGTKVAFVATQANLREDNGVYVLSLNSLANNFLGNTQLTQIADLSSFDYTKSELYWSPDSTQILAIFTDEDTGKITASHTLNARNFNRPRDLTDSTIRLPLIISQWERQLATANKSNLELLPDYMVDIITNKAVNAYFSPDQEKVLYTATQDFDLSDNPLRQSLPSLNSTPETRSLKTGNTYVFDIKEGTNYLISEGELNSDKLQKTFVLTPANTGSEATASGNTPSPTTTSTTTPNAVKVSPTPTAPAIDPTILSLRQIAAQSNSLTVGNFTWYSTSRHLFIVSPEGINVVEYDGNNKTQIIQTNILNSLVVPSSDGHRLLVLTNLNQTNTPANIFSIDLK